MNTLKKIGGVLAALCLTVGCTAGVTACGNGGNEPKNVSYTITLEDQDGDKISGVLLTLSRDDETVTTATTNAEGTVTVELAEGTYTLTMDAETMTGFIPDAYTIAVTVSAENPSLKVEVEDMSPNGTAERPYVFSGGESGAMEITLPVGAEYNYVVYRAMGRYLIIENADVEVVYLGTTYAPVDGTVSVQLEGLGDSFVGANFAIVNKASAEQTLTIKLQDAPGSRENPYPAELGKEYTTSITGSGETYYTWTATASGTLTLTLSNPSENSNAYLYNLATYAMSDGTAGGSTASVTVNAGDVIQIVVGASSTDTTDVTELSFALSLVTE